MLDRARSLPITMAITLAIHFDTLDFIRYISRFHNRYRKVAFCQAAKSGCWWHTDSYCRLRAGLVLLLSAPLATKAEQMVLHWAFHLLIFLFSIFSPGLAADFVLDSYCFFGNEGRTNGQVQSESIYCYDLQEMLSICLPRFPARSRIADFVLDSYCRLRAGLVLLLSAPLATKAEQMVLQVTQVQSESIYC